MIPAIFNNSTNIAQSILTNCIKCTVAPIAGTSAAIIRGEDGVAGSQRLLVHGWYLLETDVDIYWQQLNPNDACNANPLANGHHLAAGGCARFFVEESIRDGVIAVFFSAGTIPSLADPNQSDRPEGVVRIVRDDTILPASVTGDNATLMQADCVPGVCQ